MWERSRNRYGYWIDGERLIYIGKERFRSRWNWSIDIPPYTWGRAGRPLYAKRDALEALNKARGAGK